jgi:hypothetical protein
MAGEGTGRTRDDLFKFLKFTASKGLINKKTVENRTRACKAILGILDETEASDLSKVNLEDVILRHRNLATSTLTPKSLTGYESHVRSALKDFLEYAKNPSSWRPGRQERKKTPKSAVSAKTHEKPEGKGIIQAPIHIDFQIHISPEATPEQIDHIFDSMRRHLYGNKIGK